MNTKGIQEELARCRSRAEAYLHSVTIRDADATYWLHNPVHDLTTHPSHVLYGSWAGAMASVLLGIDERWSQEHIDAIERGFRKHQREDGFFYLGGLSDEASADHDDMYVTYHCTNYVLGALSAIGRPPTDTLASLDLPETPDELTAWLDDRDLDRPWMEGNNVVNLASFYAALSDAGHDWAGERFDQMLAWHDENQNDRTGFWHNGAAETTKSLRQAMAGGAHNLHLYFVANRDVPRYQNIVDSCLRLGYQGIRSACLDIDMVDILVNMRRYDYRLAEIDRILKAYLIELLQIQNVDGGFADSYVAPKNVYGCVTPARMSSTWTTWFRLAAIGMIACVLIPGNPMHWTFRETIGMGYFNPSYARGRSLGKAIEAYAGTVPRALHGVKLAAVREARFFRQRTTWHLRKKVQAQFR